MLGETRGRVVFANWGGTAWSYPKKVVSPRKVEELQEIMQEVLKYPSPVRAAGSFHSLTACFESSGTQVLMKGFDKIEVDLQGGVVRVGAGVSMLQLRDALRPLKMSTEVTPEIGNATAGSVACGGTKDASIRGGLGQVASSVIGMRMVNTRGEIEEVNEETDSERMRVLRSSYGLLGIVFEVKFKIRPVVMLAYEYANFRLDPPPSRSEMLSGADGMLSFAQPYSNRIIVERRRIVGSDEEASSWSKVKRRLRDKTWETGVAVLPTLLPYNWLYGMQDHLLAGQLQVLNLLGGYKGYRYDSTINFKNDRKTFFDFSFWALPASSWEVFVPAYRKFCLSYLKMSGFRSSLPSEVYWMSKDNKALLSPSNKEDVFTMDPVDTRPNAKEWVDLNERFNALAAGFGGRPLLNQTKGLNRNLVEQTLGEDWEKFCAIRDKEDKKGRLLNDYFRDLIEG